MSGVQDAMPQIEAHRAMAKGYAAHAQAEAGRAFQAATRAAKAARRAEIWCVVAVAANVLNLAWQIVKGFL